MLRSNVAAAAPQPYVPRDEREAEVLADCEGMRDMFKLNLPSIACGYYSPEQFLLKLQQAVCSRTDLRSNLEFIAMYNQLCEDCGLQVTNTAELALPQQSFTAKVVPTNQTMRR